MRRILPVGLRTAAPEPMPVVPMRRPAPPHPYCMAAARTPRPRPRAAATSSSTGGGGRLNGGGLSAARQAELQQQRRESFEKLDRGVCALKAKDPKVRELMEKTEKFLTTTEIGNDLLTVLLYPPTESLKSGRSFG